MDILFDGENGRFSLRAAGVCVRNGKVLLQSVPGDPGYAFPGGHIAFGETAKETLTREFFEETGAEASVGRLLFTGEIFFPWDGRPSHQICLYFETAITGGLPDGESFPVHDSVNGKEIPLVFSWVPLRELRNISVYPPEAAELLLGGNTGAHFVYRE